MSEKKKRERGANYTPEDKALLSDIILKFKHIIENKRTGGIYLQKKKEAWDAVTIKYNSNCSTGSRTTEQLKALYDNMKQKTKKDVGELNKHNYILSKNQNVSTEDLQKALKNIKHDKVEMHKTGGGYWRPVTRDSDTKILSIIQDQVEPLKNPYDSAAMFFQDKDELPLLPSPGQVIEVIDDPPVTEYATEGDVIDIIDPQPSTSYVTENSLTPNINPLSVTLPSDSNNNDFNYCLLNRDRLRVTPKCSKPSTPNVNKTPKRTKTARPKARESMPILRKPSSAEAFKKLYFKKKCRNAEMERKKLSLEILHLNKKHSLEMLILKKQLAKLSE